MKLHSTQSALKALNKFLKACNYAERNYILKEHNNGQLGQEQWKHPLLGIRNSFGTLVLKLAQDLKPAPAPTEINGYFKIFFNGSKSSLLVYFLHAIPWRFGESLVPVPLNLIIIQDRSHIDDAKSPACASCSILAPDTSFEEIVSFLTYFNLIPLLGTPRQNPWF